MGEFDLEEMLSFFCREIGPVFYNQGVADARTFVAKHFAGMTEDMAQLEVGS